jgi:hypothetical protein
VELPIFGGYSQKTCGRRAEISLIFWSILIWWMRNLNGLLPRQATLRLFEGRFHGELACRAPIYLSESVNFLPPFIPACLKTVHEFT